MHGNNPQERRISLLRDFVRANGYRSRDCLRSHGHHPATIGAAIRRSDIIGYDGGLFAITDRAADFVREQRCDR